MILLYTDFFRYAAGPGIVAAIVMIILGFFFAAVSGNLVGMIGSSNNPDLRTDARDPDDRGAADGG